MRNLYVPLERDELDNLVALAQKERRRPADQAAVLILEGLKAQIPEPLCPAPAHSVPLSSRALTAQA